MASRCEYRAAVIGRRWRQEIAGRAAPRKERPAERELAGQTGNVDPCPLKFKEIRQRGRGLACIDKGLSSLTAGTLNKLSYRGD